MPSLQYVEDHVCGNTRCHVYLWDEAKTIKCIAEAELKNAVTIW